MRQLVLVVLATSIVYGCTANVFKDPVTAFDAAVATTKATADGYDQASPQLLLTGEIFTETPNAHSVLFDPQACDLGRPDGCRLTVVNKHGKPIVLLPAPVQISPAANALATIKAYSANLVMIVTATTSADLDKSVGDLSNSLTSIGNAVGATALGNVGPLTTLVQFLGGNYVEYKRLQILRDAITEADKSIQKQAPNLTAAIRKDQKMISTLSRNLIVVLAAQAGATRDDFQRRALLTEAVSKSAELRDLLKADPGEAVLKLAIAHAALAKAVQEPDAGLQTTYQALLDFAKQAKSAYDAINKF